MDSSSSTPEATGFLYLALLRVAHISHMLVKACVCGSLLTSFVVLEVQKLLD